MSMSEGEKVGQDEVNAWVYLDCESGMAMSGLGYEISPLRSWWTISLRLALSIMDQWMHTDFSYSAQG